MADGNISVDVAKNESYYTGDFKVLAESPKSIRTNFTNVMRDITHIASQVDSEENQVSAGAAKSTGTPVSRSIHDVTTGTQSTDLVLSAMQPINECMQSIKVLMDEISLASAQQAETIDSVENKIKEVSNVTQANHTAAEESATISTELSNQAKTLNRPIGQFRIN